jgi:hypothetical protein
MVSLRSNKSGMVNVAMVFLAVLAILVWIAAQALTGKVTPMGDYAADMLLANRIRDEGVLLVGHYSRWEFNHPGPFWFYYNHAMEVLFAWTHASRQQLWLLGNVLLNAVFATFAAFALSRYALERAITAGAALVIVVLIGLLGTDLVSMWMPYRMITPYLAFCACLLHLADGNHRYLPGAAFLASILIHGYATMPVFTLPLLLACLAIGWLRTRRQIDHAGLRRHVALACGIGALFAVPILWDAFSGADSNAAKLLAAQARFSKIGGSSWEEMRVFALRLVFERNAIRYMLALPLILLLALISDLPEKLKAKRLAVSLLFVALTFMTVIYYKSTPGPVHSFVAQFYVALPVVLLSFFLMALASARKMQAGPEMRGPGMRKPGLAFKPAARSLLILLALVAILLPVGRLGPNERSEAVESFAQFMREHRQGGSMIAIDYIDHDTWPFMAGLLLELDRQGIPACTTWQQMSFLYTRKETCPTEVLPSYLIVKSDRCDGQCLLDMEGFGLRSPQSAPVGKGEVLSGISPKLFFWNWSGPEPGIRWSLGPASSIRFLLANDGGGALPASLTLTLASFGRQSFDVLLNNVRIYSGKAESAPATLTIPLPPGSIRAGENVLHFNTPDASRPKGDNRMMALDLKSLSLN